MLFVGITPFINIYGFGVGVISFTADSTVITADSTIRTADEA